MRTSATPNRTPTSTPARRAGAPLLALLVLPFTGCYAVQSDAVRTLIEEETRAINKANDAMAELANLPTDQVKAWRSALDALNTSMQANDKAAARHGVNLSPKKKLNARKGEDAHAIAHVLSQVYLANRAGLNDAVKAQFEQDFTALATLWKKLWESWKGIKELQTKVQEFSDSSAFASIDPALVAAIAAEVPEGGETIKEVLKHAEQVQDLLQRAERIPALDQRRLDPARIVSTDVVDLLRRVEGN